MVKSVRHARLKILCRKACRFESDYGYDGYVTSAWGDTVYEYSKISTATYNLDGRKITVRVVRDSKICRLLTKKDSIVIGNTIYIRYPRMTPRMLRAGLNEIEARPLWLHRLWQMVGK